MLKDYYDYPEHDGILLMSKVNYDAFIKLLGIDQDEE